MKTIFDQDTINGVIHRIHDLQANDLAQWGKMNAYQITKHCTMSEEMFLGKKVYKRLFIGKLFGPAALKGILKDESPMKRSQPTHPEFKITTTGDFEKQRQQWIELLQAYKTFGGNDFIHPFFGKMSKEEIGRYVYKHTDHHLRQLGK